MSHPIAHFKLLDDEMTAHTLDLISIFSKQLQLIGQGHRQVVVIKLNDWLKLSDSEKERGRV